LFEYHRLFGSICMPMINANAHRNDRKTHCRTKAHYLSEKIPSTSYNWEGKKVRFFEQEILVFYKFLDFHQKGIPQSVLFCRDNTPSKGRQRECPFYNQNSKKKFIFYVLHKKVLSISSRRKRRFGRNILKLLQNV